MKRQSPPQALFEFASSRTHQASEQVEQAKRNLRAQLQSGELEQWLKLAKRKRVKESDVLRLTTLGPNFLNGKKHRETTKAEVGRWLEGLNADLESWRTAQKCDAPLETDWRQMYLESVSRHDRLLTRAHGWKNTLLGLARENRELKKKLGLKVVPIKR